MAEEVRHITVNGKYRIKIEKAAGVKTGDGFCVEANSDNIEEVQREAQTLYNAMKQFVTPTLPPAI